MPRVHKNKNNTSLCIFNLNYFVFYIYYSCHIYILHTYIYKFILRINITDLIATIILVYAINMEQIVLNDNHSIISY